ncbi:unnamed protein product, partial [Iphiclides podalirius]
MVRVITQETYEEIVKENIEAFDMTPEDAMKEAIAQFEAQGVDLSNIIKDISLDAGQEHLVSMAVKNLKELTTTENNDDELIVNQLDILMKECNKDIAHRVRAGKDGAYKILLDFLEAKQKKYIQDENAKDGDIIVKVLNTFVSLMDSQPDLLEKRGIDTIKINLDMIKDESILIATLKWAVICCNVKLLTETLQLIRKLTLDDDVRVEFGKAHDHARELGVQLLEPLTDLLKENTKPPLAGDLMLTIASLLVRHELCALVADRAPGLPFTVLADNYDNVAVVQQAIKFLPWCGSV